MSKCQKQQVAQGKPVNAAECERCGRGPCPIIGNNDELGYVVINIVNPDPKTITSIKEVK